jgi:hypothetical protein
MSHYLTSDDKYHGLPYGGDNPGPGPCRFGRDLVAGGRGRSALDRVNGCLKNLFETIANAKVRRMLRELELRGIRFDQSDEVWIASSLREPRA